MAVVLSSPRSPPSSSFNKPEKRVERVRFAAAAAARTEMSVQESQALLRAAAESGAQQRRLASESSRVS